VLFASFTRLLLISECESGDVRHQRRATHAHGISLGTPAHESGQAAVSADVNARHRRVPLAVLVYEMIVGEVPGRWVTEIPRAPAVHRLPESHRPYLAAAGVQVEGGARSRAAPATEQRTATRAISSTRSTESGIVNAGVRPPDMVAGDRECAPPRSKDPIRQ